MKHVAAGSRKPGREKKVPGEYLSRAAVGAGAAAALVGGAHLVAWLTGYMAWRGFSQITMKANAALAMLLAGITLVLLAPEKTGRTRRWAARAGAAPVLLIGILSLSQHLFGWDLGIDQLLAQEPPGAMGTTHPNRIGPPASLIYLLTGISLLILSREDRRGVAMAQGLALGACLTALLGTVGHLYGVKGLYDLERWTAIAWPTATGLLAIGIGLLCARPGEGMMAQVTADDPGGAIIRRLLLPALLLPLGLGWLRLLGESRGLYDTPQGTALIVLGFVIVFSLIVIQTGRRLSRATAAERRINEALRESEGRYRLVNLATNDVIWDWDLGNDQLLWNQALQSVFGYRSSEVPPEISWWYEHIHPDDRDRVVAGIHAVIDGGGSTWTAEYRFRRADGEYATVLDRGHIQHDAQGKPIRMVGSMLDLTESRRNEEALRQTTEEIRMLNTELERRVEERTAELTAANRELEAFSYTVSHDLRAPLRHITGFVGLLRARSGADLDEQGNKYLQIVAEAAGRMDSLIEDLLTFSRISRAPVHKTSLNLQNLTEEVRRELEPEAAGRRIEWNIGDLPQVQADAVLLRTVLTNLLSNALKYTRQRDPALIEIGCRQEESELVYFIRDNGAGFDMKCADKLFGVFQRLHRPQEFEGTGIGLASVRRIIQRHGGRTWAEGEPEKGATFYFSLPLKGIEP